MGGERMRNGWVIKGGLVAKWFRESGCGLVRLSLSLVAHWYPECCYGNRMVCRSFAKTCYQEVRRHAGLDSI